MTSKKNILILVGITLLFFITAFIDSNDMEMNKIQNEEYKAAIRIAEKLLPELKLKRDDYKIITIENMVISGDKYEGPNIWKITFKSKTLFRNDDMMGKGGEIFIKVNLEAKKASLIGYGE